MRPLSQNHDLGYATVINPNKSLAVRSARAKWSQIAAMLASVADVRGWCGAALHGGWFSFVTLSYIKRGIESRCLDSGYLPEPSAHRSKSEFGMMMINKGPVIGQVGRLPGAAP
jgi:hypothetical protein